MEEYLEFAINIANYAGEIMKKYFFDNNLFIEYKSDYTPVTIADKQINDYLITEVNKKYPSHTVLGEEKSKVTDSKYAWVCDPIDGTSMFTRHIPVSVFSLALVYDGEPILGVIYDPFLNEMYTAIKGHGAFCNGQRISVNDKEYGSLGCTIDYCMWNRAKYDTLQIIKDIRNEVKTCQIGSVAHACMLVASGKISGEIFPGTAHGNCDLAASKIIVEEAGGLVTDFHGHEQRYDQDIDGAIATNKKVHPKLLAKVKRNI